MNAAGTQANYRRGQKQERGVNSRWFAPLIAADDSELARVGKTQATLHCGKLCPVKVELSRANCDPIECGLIEIPPNSTCFVMHSVLRFSVTRNLAGVSVLLRGSKRAAGP